MRFWNTENIHTIIDNKFQPLLQKHKEQQANVRSKINTTNLENDKRNLCLQDLALIQSYDELVILQRLLHAYASLPIECWRTRKSQRSEIHIDPSKVRSFLSLLTVNNLRLNYENICIEDGRVNQNGEKIITNIVMKVSDDVSVIIQCLIKQYQQDTAAQPYFKPNPILTPLDWAMCFLFASCLLAAMFAVVIFGIQIMPVWSVMLIGMTTGLLGFAFAGLYSDSCERYKAIYKVIDDPSSTNKKTSDIYNNLLGVEPNQEDLNNAFTTLCL